MSKKFIFKRKIGMRTLKTALAVLIGLYASDLLRLDSYIFTAIASITAMKSSFSESFTDIKKRMFTCIFGVTLGYILSLVPTDRQFIPIIASLGIIIVIYILQVVSMTEMIPLSCIVYIASFSTDAGQFMYGLNRIIGTFLGIVIAVFINYAISTPDVFKSFIDTSRDALEQSKNFVLQLIMRENTDITNFEKAFTKTKEAFSLLKNEYDTPLHLKFNFQKAEQIMKYLDDIDLRFKVLSSIEEVPIINDDNINAINDIFKLNYIQTGTLEGDLNIVFNLHLHKILINLYSIEALLGEDNYEKNWFNFKLNFCKVLLY